MAAAPALRQQGIGFLTGTTWDPNTGQFGILPEIWGTLYTSWLALIIGTAFGVAAAIFLSEGFLAQSVFRILRVFGLEFHPLFGKLPDQVEALLKNLIELLAAIPSVVYGLWGLFVVIPTIRPMCNWLNLKLGWIPFFGTTLTGPGLLPAVIVLSIMILPTITVISRDALASVPSKLRMAAYGMGATRWETILAVILPTAARGIVGAVVLAFGRALGRDHGIGHARGKREPHECLSVLARKYPCGAAGQQLPGGRQERRGSAHVCGADPAGDYPSREHHRLDHAGARILRPGRRKVR